MGKLQFYLFLTWLLTCFDSVYPGKAEETKHFSLSPPCDHSLVWSHMTVGAWHGLTFPDNINYLHTGLSQQVERRRLRSQFSKCSGYKRKFVTESRYQASQHFGSYKVVIRPFSLATNNTKKVRNAKKTNNCHHDRHAHLLDIEINNIAYLFLSSSLNEA